MWNHQCPEDGSLEIGEGEACSWCGCTQEQEPARDVRQSLSDDFDPND